MKSRFAIGYSLYFSLFIVVVNIFLYFLYHAYPGAHPPLFVFKVNLFNVSQEIFIFFMLVCFFINLVCFFAVNRKELRVISIIQNEVLIALNLVISLIFLPISLALILAYIGMLLMNPAIVYVRLLSPSEIELRADTNNLVILIQLLHNEWLEFLRLSIWTFITILVGGISATIALMASTGVMKLGGTELWGYPMGQMIFIGILVLFGSSGVLLGVTEYCHSVLKRLRSILTQSKKN